MAPGWLMALALASACACLAVLYAAKGAGSEAAPARLRPITPDTTIAEVARHFGAPTWRRFRAGTLTSIYVARLHDRTIVVYIHPRPRP